MTLPLGLAQARAGSDPVAIDTAAVREAIAAVFADDVYRRSLRESLWSRLQHWLGEIIARIFGSVNESPPLKWALIGAAVLMVAAFAARLVYVASMSADATPRARRRTIDPSLDPLLLARAAAADRRFMEAAHLLYLAILDELRRTERLKLDPSKTLGEYRRDLAARSSGAYHAFRKFTGMYENIVWGLRSCDEPAYEQLAELAASLVTRAHYVPGRR
ncbi:MAG: DUF4129 domain-containing protein [Gemmatimonadaceae bacterium]|nr:DUF4129 domain-containing protein [Gemmatimonadaceae bacterium]